MRLIAKTIVASTALWAFVLAPVAVAYAETITANSGTYNFNSATGNYEVSNDTQFAKYAQGRIEASSQSIGQGLGQAAGQCVFGSMLSQLLTSFISYLVGQVLSALTLGLVEGVFRVPVMVNPSTRGDIRNSTAKEVCALALWGYCILPSLDAIAFCFINEVIHYIAQATIQWIKGGFEGSPAFIDDPGKFFRDATDSIAGGLLNEITGGLLCEPFRANVQLRLLNEHVGSYRKRAGGCKLSEVSDRWEDWADGDFVDFGTHYAATQNPYGNEWGSYLESKLELQRRIAGGTNTLQMEVGWSDGFLHVKDPETGKVTTPGRVIEDQLNRRLGLAENRLLIADEFDEVINTLVNELVRLTLSELLNGDEGGGEDGDSGITGGGDTIDHFDFGHGGDVDVVTNPNGGGSTGGGTDPDGGTDGIGSDLVVSCDFDDDRVLEGETATATAVVSGSVGTVTYDWDQNFTGAGTSTGRYFEDEGVYFALIRVSDQDWDREEASATCDLTVSEDFEVRCTVDKTRIEPGDRVLYTATVIGNDGDVEDYDWGGAASGSGQSVSKRYSTSGTYGVHVEVVDEEGNRESAACPDVVAANS